MARVKFCKGKQRKFLEEIINQLGFDVSKIASICNVCDRTIRDWRREKYLITYEASLKLCKISSRTIPKNIKILPDYWSTKKAARLGAIRRYELYGNPGTPEGRRKGGMISRDKTRKKITIPEKSSSLAEFVGILLGDGGIRGDHQVTISFNMKTDKRFSIFIRKLIKDLFGIDSSIFLRKGANGADIVISSKNLVEFLAKENILKKGDKIKNQIDIPKWIKENRNYKVSCLCGLMDTDGGIYYHRYKAYRRWYKYPRLSFTSASKFLLNSVNEILEDLNFNPKKNGDSVILYRLPELKRYFEEIGTHNPKHLARYKKVAKAECN